MKRPRFVIEGTWSGYSSSQQRVAHRKVYSGGRKLLREWAEKQHAIYYDDGTALYLSVRDCKPRERVDEIKGYTSLIEDCFHYRVNRVSDIKPARESARSGASAGVN